MKNKYVITLNFLSILLMFNCQNPLENNFNDKIQNVIDVEQIPGLAIGIIKGNALVFSKGYGYADIENKIPFTTQTIINIASASKAILGACIMHAVENNKLSLDEPINNYLPFKVINPHTNESNITLKHLATHTSGIIDDNDFYYSDKNYYNGGLPPLKLGDLLESYLTQSGENYHKKNFSPDSTGKTFHYSNIGAALAGYIFEAKLGISLNEYAETHIFEPLHMSKTGYSLSDEDIRQHSKLYDDSLQEIKLYDIVMYPDGGIRTNMTDLSNFLISIMNNGVFNDKRILNEASVTNMIAPYFKNDSIIQNFNPLHCNHGLFWLHLGETTPTAKIGHAGGDSGVRIYMYFDPQTETGVIILMNKLVNIWNDQVYSNMIESVWKYASEL